MKKDRESIGPEIPATPPQKISEGPTASAPIRGAAINTVRNPAP